VLIRVEHNSEVESLLFRVNLFPAGYLFNLGLDILEELVLVEFPLLIGICVQVCTEIVEWELHIHVYLRSFGSENVKSGMGPLDAIIFCFM
jgi:hypothetical protein